MAVFDDWKSYVHFLVGFLAAQNFFLTLVTTIIFIFYQQREKEKEESKLGDYIEFLLGFVLGLSF